MFTPLFRRTSPYVPLKVGSQSISVAEIARKRSCYVLAVSYDRKFDQGEARGIVIDSYLCREIFSAMEWWERTNIAGWARKCYN